MAWQILSVIPVWLLALVGAILVAITGSPAQHLTWLGIVLAGVTIITFWIQLAISRKEGFVNRVMASIGGAVLLLAAASGIFALLG